MEFDRGGLGVGRGGEKGRDWNKDERDWKEERGRRVSGI